MLVVLLVLPLQATAEELLFRGFGPQIIQGKIGSSAATFWVTHVVFAMLFASLHGGSGVTAWLMFIVFGLIFSYVVYATGGLEGATALHAVNNVSVFAMGALRDTGAVAKQGDATLGGAEVGQIVALGASAVIITLLARRHQAEASPRVVQWTPAPTREFLGPGPSSDAGMSP